MANHASHAALPYPVKGARFTLQIGFLDATGTPTDPVVPDTEISKDGGAFADTTEEVTVIAGANGLAWLTLTATEMDCSMFSLATKVASGPKASLIPDGRPRVLPVLLTGTATTGAAGSITLATTAPSILGFLVGCIVKTTGGTGGGGANNQARVITGYTASRVASVVPNWEVTPDATTTYEVLLTDTAYAGLADVVTVLNDDLAATRLQRALNTEVLVTVTTGATVTNIPTSSLIPAAVVTDQFRGRVLLFDRTTTTTGLRGAGSKITSSTTGGVLTVDALPTTPVSGDTAVIA